MRLSENLHRRELTVKLDGVDVGRLVETTRGTTLFQYSNSWIESGYSISPFKMPLSREIFQAEWTPFEGVHGVFADSIPDGWGRLLMDRFMLKTLKRRPEDISSFQRLMLVNDTGIGALSYEPNFEILSGLAYDDYDELRQQCDCIYDTEYDGESADFDRIFSLGGSSGGARPKLHIKLGGEDWIIKFPSSIDDKNIGFQEYEYMECAKACGIETGEIRLLESELCKGYYAVKRFDREIRENKLHRIHMISVSGLLDVSHRVPNLDYNDLFKIATVLTRDQRELWKLFRVMCFNVYAHNRDDHSRNFSFLCRNGVWRLSPAYDLTYSNSIGGEHATTVNGNGVNPGMKEILEVARRNNLEVDRAAEIAAEIENMVACRLKKYL